MPSNYDNAAIFYDQLSRMVFGKALIRSQVYLLHFIPPNSSVLIVGGGTGWILEELSHIHYSGLTITYVEISARMTALAQKRFIGNNKVTFSSSPVEELPMSTLYDVVLTPFLFDNFSEETLALTFAHIHKQLKANGLWLCADFQLTGKLWQKVLLQAMYLFFKLLCRIETTSMPDIERQFTQYGYRKLISKTFFGNFIISTKYQKQ